MAERAVCTSRRGLHVLIASGLPELGPKGPRKKGADEIRLIAPEVLEYPQKNHRITPALKTTRV